MDTSDLRYWVDEATKRNDRTYAALEQILKALPSEGPEGDVHREWADAEQHQQAARRALIRLRAAVQKLSH